MRQLPISISVLFALLAVLGVPRSAVAQETVPTPSPTEALFTVTLPALPPASVPIVLERVIIEPGEDFSIGSSSGPALYYDEEGDSRVVVDGPATLATGGPVGTPSVPEELTVGSEVTIERHDLLMVPAGSSVQITGDAQVPTQILVVTFFAGDHDRPLPAGVSREPLAATEMPILPPGPVRVTLERITLERGATTLPRDVTGTELVALESSAAAIALQRGEGQIVRAHGAQETIVASPGDPFAQAEPDSDAEPDPEPDPEAEAPEATKATGVEIAPVPALQGSVVGLTVKDAVLLRPGSVRVLQGVGDVPAVLFLLQITTDDFNTGTPLLGSPTP